MTTFVPFQGSSEKKVGFSFFYSFFCAVWVGQRSAYAKCSTSCPLWVILGRGLNTLYVRA